MQHGLVRREGGWRMLRSWRKMSCVCDMEDNELELESTVPNGVWGF